MRRNTYNEVDKFLSKGRRMMGMFDRIKSIWRANQKEGQAAVVQRDLLSMRVGDILTYDLEDYHVEGVTVYRNGALVKKGYLLKSGSVVRYLTAEQKETVRAYLYETLNG